MPPLPDNIFGHLHISLCVLPTEQHFNDTFAASLIPESSRVMPKCPCKLQVMFENGYLAAHVDMLKHQHKYTSQILADSTIPVSMSTATDCRMQAPAANICPLNLKKRPAAICATPTKPDRYVSFPGFCASRPQATPSPTYPDFKAFSTKQPACASSGACLCRTKRYKQNMAHSQPHCLNKSDTARPHTVEHMSTTACGFKA